MPRRDFTFVFAPLLTLRFLVIILVCVLAAYGLGFYLAVPANPEVAFWSMVMQRRDSEIAKVRSDLPNSPIVFFTGGSSTAFSIDPKIIEEICELPAFNLGLPVAAGDRYILHQALGHCQKGDVLIVCLEPDLLTYPNNESCPTQLSFALATAMGKPSDAAGGETFAQNTGLRDYLNLSRPGPAYLATLVAKKITNRGYRYTPADIRYHGRMETPITDPHMTPHEAGKSARLTLQGRQLLTKFKQAAFQRGVHVAYSMPWFFTSQASLAESRANHLKTMEGIQSIMPAIDDGFAGAASDPAWFSDSPQHLTAEGSLLRSHALAMAIKEWMLSLQ